ncbi:peptide/nickel transport system substrate-binding protein [Tistlia consotensis]|uniref:Peptide/nickel transport system substrate-binding protein n=1 Tax=Tistlia consotensis USBA 355 TaxID=560819 RepID=A0A1Y6BM68_9PROT|nr:ABC transporter substrate-binding protein [Tistlia consotensis]SMF19144.1 peptide/nickel transport system substrate-binding protein [Tistlia consotensis USBA 355]SNR39202.1 peptide/nickel transport system substrate-binding protein [Tistlia consotensis]
MNRILAACAGGAFVLGLAQAALSGTALVGTALADDLTIGLASEPSALDPHYHNLTPNNAAWQHIFDGLISQDAKQRLQPGLAVAWKPLDATTWEFDLRKGVTFHDGTPFDAEDVIYTIRRIPNVANSPSSFTIYTKSIASMEAKDPYTLIIKTEAPRPLLPTELSNLAIISKETCEGASGGDWPKTEDFNSGTLAVGTGPYKFAEFVKGDRLVLTRNDDYWGGKPTWDKVTFKPISSDGPRVAALLSGDVDVIDNPPTQDLPRLKADKNINVYSGLSNRVIYLHMDQFADDTPGVQGTNGRNPFKDKRVREAVSKAIDRKAIVEKIMGGVAVAAEQLLPKGMFGADPALEVEAYDPAGARKLLAEAGYPDGFKLVLGTPNDRYINDEKVAQAVAQFLTRVGIQTTVDASTKSVFFKRRNSYEFSMYLAGWGSGTGEMSSPLRALVATPDKEKGYGGTNRGRYSNPAVDAKIDEALQTLDDAGREKLLQEASDLVIKDYGILPLHYEVTSWATRKGLAYEPRTDQYTSAMSVTQAQ